MKITCIQFYIQLNNVKGNMDRMKVYIKQAVSNKADVVVLPELWTTGYNIEHMDELLEAHEYVIKEMEKLAQQYGITIIAGSIPTMQDNEKYNTLLVVSKDGTINTSYKKVHLLQSEKEHLYFKRGRQHGLFSINDITAAGFICSDLRYPEWFRLHAVNGAEIMFVVAQWPKNLIEQWRLMLQSRAIENQCFIIGCNTVGSRLNEEFGGHSMIVNPYGNIIAEGCGEEEELISSIIDVHKVKEIRKIIPISIDEKQHIFPVIQTDKAIEQKK